MDEVQSHHQVRITFEVVQRNESPATAVDAPVVTLLAQAVEAVYGVKGQAVGVGGGTVGAYLRRAGYPCVVWSRQDETMHSPNEYARLANIIGDAKVFLHLMMASR
jgi:succinyl-diaminopimelate desuccinylase